jgi:hypothetical protein
METKYLMMLLVIPTITLPMTLIGMQQQSTPAGQPTSPEGMCVVFQPPIVQTEEEAILIEEERKTAALQQATSDVENEEDWQVISSKELAELKAELKQALEANKQAKTKLSRLYDFALGATAITVTEAAFLYWCCHKGINWVYKHRKGVSTIWLTLPEFMDDD